MFFAAAVLVVLSQNVYWEMNFQSLFHCCVKEMWCSELNILEGIAIFIQKTVFNSDIICASWDFNQDCLSTQYCYYHRSYLLERCTGHVQGGGCFTIYSNVKGMNSMLLPAKIIDIHSVVWLRVHFFSVSFELSVFIIS